MKINSNKRDIAIYLALDTADENYQMELFIYVRNTGNEVKILKNENKALKKELNRKDKALAETAALLVLQKKVHEIWGNDEDSSL